ncbi:MAG: DUF1214 domain-containing protein [Actinobacteria bacterium]|nr:DUF1214 domain-containing protein [Actinomycetota bacterium]MSY72958.1 DUF1214 domain-containing protein [Actinomycetota bacterium]
MPRAPMCEARRFVGEPRAEDIGMSTDESTTVSVTDAWRAFCGRLADMGAVIEGGDFPQDALAQAEGVRFLARMTALALQQATDFSDPDFPVIYRLNDDATKWAGPNVDNIYLAAAVKHPHVYTLRGTTARSGGFILQTLTGWWGEERFRIHDDRSSSVFVPETDGSIAITIGGPEQPTNWMPLHPDADCLFIREYAIDWATDDRCAFVLERVADEPVVQLVLDAARVCGMLEQAAHWVEHTTVFWNKFEAQMMRPLEPNSFGPVFTAPGGGSDIFYGNGWVDLAPDDALIVHVTVPVARYWSLQLYNEAWYESLDFGSRCTNRNNTQVHVDADGVVRFVIATRDPGTPNWLDLAGHQRAFAHFRAVWCTAATQPRCTLTTIDAVRDLLPTDHPVISPAQRIDELRTRHAQVTRRHRR